MKLTEKEPWFIASQQGAQIYVQFWGDKKFWWLLVFVELDTGLAKIDVCGKIQNIDLSDCSRLKVDDEEPIENENFYDIR